MLGCTSSRSKSATENPSLVRAHAKDCVQRSADSVAFEFDLQAVGSSAFHPKDVVCYVQALEQGTFSSSWVAVSNSCWYPNKASSDSTTEEAQPSAKAIDLKIQSATQGSEPVPATSLAEAVGDKEVTEGSHSHLPCLALVSGLPPEKDFVFRVLARGSMKEQVEASKPVKCRTSDRPLVEEGRLTCVRRTAYTVELTWELQDPDGAPVLECELQYRSDAILSSWLPLQVERPCGQVGSSTSRCAWRSIITNLEGDLPYRVRMRAQNSVGWSTTFSPPLVCYTSDRPQAPDNLVACGRRPGSAILRFTVNDPVGAPVHTYSAFLQGVMGYSQHAQCRFEEEPAEQDESGHYKAARRNVLCIVGGLPSETEFWMRLSAQNDSGVSKQHSQPVRFKTSKRPESPEALCVEVGPSAIAVEWDQLDPVGAPVLRCELEYCRDTMFGGWEKVEAEPMGIVGEGMANEDLAEMAAALEVAKLMAVTSMQRRWRVLLDGLDRETVYLLRAQSLNCVGWSESFSPTVTARTTDKPPPPHHIKCTARVPTGVWLEVSVAEVLGTPPVNGIVVEKSGSLSWHEVQEVEVKKLRNSDNASHWEIFVMLGVTPGAHHDLRAWAVNIFGRSAKPSEMCLCQTSDKPSPPARIKGVYCLPNAICLEWVAPDPEGAPVWRFQVQGRKDVSFSSWQLVGCAETRRVGRTVKSRVIWRSVIDKLEAASSYRFIIRGLSEVGWSDWSPETVFDTSAIPPALSLPPLPQLTAMPDMDASSVQEGPSHSYISVDLTVTDPEGAPTVACLVRVKDHAWVLARRAALPIPIGAAAPPQSGEQVAGVAEQVAGPEVVGAAATVRPSSPPQDVAAFLGTTDRPVCPGVLPTDGSSEAIDSAAPAGAEARASASTAAIPEDTDLERQRRHSQPSQSSDFLQGERKPRLRNSAPPKVADKSRASVATAPAAGARVKRDTTGQWRVCLPRPESSAKSDQVQLSVRIANAVGWARTQEFSLTLGKEATEHPDDPTVPKHSFSYGTLDVVAAGVRDVLALQTITTEGLQELFTEATARNDQDHVASLSAYKTEVEQRMEVLQAVAQQVEVSMSSKEDQGALLAQELQSALARPKLAPTAGVAAIVLSLLLKGYIWLERSWRAELKSMTNDIAEARSAIPASGGSVLLSWASQHQAWSDAFERRVADALPEGLARAAQLLATLASGRKLEFAEAVRGDLEACLTLVCAAERQLQKLRNSHRILCASEGSIANHGEEKGVLKKIETTALGIATMLVLPVPGSMEIGTVNIALLWVEGDTARSHLAVQHPSGVELGPMLQRLGSSPPPRAAVIIAGWLRGGHKGVVLVHNATSRRIIATVAPKDSFASKAMSKLADAHPYMRLMNAKGGEEPTIIQPTDVALIQVPDATDHDPSARLEFAYGYPGHIERAVGYAATTTGSAVSFMRLDASCQVSNQDAGENTSVEEGTIRIVNQDLTPVNVNVFRAPEAQKSFEGALVSVSLAAGETKHVPLPQPCAGRIFKLDVSRQNVPKEICEVRAGQCLTIEG